MTNHKTHEYLCPYCAGENKILVGESNALVERLMTCQHCDKIINVTAAHGLSEEMNIVAFEFDPNELDR